MLTIDFLRHGEPVGGIRYRGSGADDPLSEAGWEQMWTAVADNPGWEQVVSSPMQRCRSFAEAYTTEHGLPLEIDERLREVGMGAWEGRSHEEVRASEPELHAAYYCDPVQHRPAGAEPLSEFVARVGAALDALVARETGHFLVVAHAGVIRATLVHALGLPLASTQQVITPYACLTRLEWRYGHVRLTAHNYRHL
ncbi:MAG: histidine phosphatase family protein [Gammaproteobacteria bacterium]